MSGIELAPGSKVFTARCKNLYILTLLGDTNTYLSASKQQ